MWWSRRWTVAVVVLAVAVGGVGCGFRPLYGTTDGDGDGAADFSAVAVAPIPDRLGQELRNHLLDLLNPKGRPEAPIYTLKVDVRERIDDLAIDSQGLATRSNLRLDSTYALIEDATGQAILEGEGLAVSSYNVVSNDYSNLTAKNDARSRAALNIARQIRARLGAFFMGRRIQASS